MKPKLKTTIVEFMLVLPALALFCLFVVYPLIGGIYYSFTNWNGIDLNMSFIGFKNYLSIFKDKYVLEPLANTFIYAFFSMILLNVLGLIFAVGLERLTRGKNLMRALLFVP
ncbi:carbohydrate ABC transporter permease, partial [Eisenbergiella porci]